MTKFFSIYDDASLKLVVFLTFVLCVKNHSCFWEKLVIAKILRFAQVALLSIESLATCVTFTLQFGKAKLIKSLMR